MRDALEEIGTGGGELKAHRLGGGCISPAARLDLRAGRRAFLKWDEAGAAPPGLFSEEARSLRSLAATKTLRVPGVLAVRDRAGEAGEAGGSGDSGGSGSAGPAWLLLEWLEPGPGGEGAWRGLGRELAALHRHPVEDYGWSSDNFIGSLPQENGPADGWADFWRRRRLEPQLFTARAAGHIDRALGDRFDRLLAGLGALLDPVAEEPPSLLHGDLWNGNVQLLSEGGAAVLDPASYRGHREVDLAMAELFGGFPAEFFEAYEESWPLQPGYRPLRRAVYQLHYLLVHVNLFGAGYLARTVAALSQAGA